MVPKSRASGRKVDPPRPFVDRLHALRTEIRRQHADAALISDPHDQYYLTGFTGEDGAVLVTRRQVWLLTDGRFTEQARESPWARAFIRKVSLAKATGRLATRLHVKTLLVQPEVMTLQAASEPRKHLPKAAKIVRAGGVVRKMRLTKSPDEVDAIRAAIRVGEEAFEVLRRRIKPGMTEAEVAALVEYEMRKRGEVVRRSRPLLPWMAMPCCPTTSRATSAHRKRTCPGRLGARLNGYCGDLTRVLLIGRIRPRVRQLYQAVSRSPTYGYCGDPSGHPLSASRSGSPPGIGPGWSGQILCAWLGPRTWPGGA